MSAFSPHALRGTPAVDAPAGLQAVLWDMDGTIVDTEPYWIAAEKDLVRRHGGQWNDADAFQLVGQALPVSAAMLRDAGVDLGIRDIIDELTSRVMEGLRAETVFRPGARELLADLLERGVPCALVTMSEQPLARLVADALPEGTFRFLVTGDMVAAGKPDPAPYHQAFDTMAAQVEGLERGRVVALEDSVPGVRSAAASGIPTIAVPHMATLPPDGDWTVWPTLEGMTAADLDAFVNTPGTTA